MGNFIAPFQGTRRFPSSSAEKFFCRKIPEKPAQHSFTKLLCRNNWREMKNRNFGTRLPNWSEDRRKPRNRGPLEIRKTFKINCFGKWMNKVYWIGACRPSLVINRFDGSFDPLSVWNECFNQIENDLTFTFSDWCQLSEWTKVEQKLHQGWNSIFLANRFSLLTNFLFIEASTTCRNPFWFHSATCCSP